MDYALCCDRKINHIIYFIKKQKMLHQIVKVTKQIFSVGVLSIILTVIGLYFTYQTFFRDKNGEIEVLISHDEKEYSLEGITFLFELSFAKTPYIIPNSYECHTPFFRNKTNRAVRGFDLKVYFELSTLDADINKETTIFDDDTYKFKTNCDLPAFSYLYGPIEEIHLVTNIDEIKAKYGQKSNIVPSYISGELMSVYRYSYDQIKNPICIGYYLDVRPYDELTCNGKYDAERYISCRNEFLDDVKDIVEENAINEVGEYRINEKERKQVGIIVRDTLVYVDNPKFFDEDYNDIDETISLEDLGRIVILK